MKKIILFGIALASCLPLVAANMEQLTQAILDNNFENVKSRLGAEYNQEDLQTALGIAQEKNTFYHQRLRRWKMGLKMAYLGLPIGTVLGAIRVADKDFSNWQQKAIKGEVGRDPALAILTLLLGGGKGATAGLAISAAFLAWVKAKTIEWQERVNESDTIVQFIASKLGT